MGLLYTKMKVFHFPEKLASLPASVPEIAPPLQLRIKPTNACNQHCWYCAYRAKNLQLGEEMRINDSIPRAKMMEIIDDAIVMGVKAVTFSGGGEPFCYPHLLEAAKRLAESPVKFASLTNGSFLAGEIAELFACHATWIRVSLDGWDDESYAAYRNCPDGEFTRIIGNMRAFTRLSGGCYLGVCIVVDQRNCRHLHRLIQFLHDTGVNSVKVAPCIVSNDGRENNAYHQPIFATVKEQLARARTDFGNAAFEIFDSYHTQLETFAKSYDWCPYLQIVPVVGADLNVYSCHDKAYNRAGLLGSIRDQRLADFWFGGKNKFFEIDPSRDCDHHCVVDCSNRLVLDYLQADARHLEFV